MKTSILLMCGGSSSRFNSNKLLAKINGKSVLQMNIDNINECSQIESIVVVLPSGVTYDLVSDIPLYYAEGGDTRTQSVANGLKMLSSDIVLIHDGARPYADKKIFDDCIESVKKYGTGIATVKLVDTIKIVDDEFSLDTPNRETLRAIQTPQGFFVSEIKKAYAMITDENFTDDSAVYEKFIGKTRCFFASEKNKKITFQEDINMVTYRVGNGYDLHRLKEGRKLILGGVHIPNELGLLGHSDADVLVHSIIDSLLSASANGDIGTHFPDTDMQYKNADSIKLLSHTAQLIQQQGFSICNITATIVCQKPKLANYILSMRKNIASVLKVAIEQVGITAKTNENVDATGESRAICVFSNCLLAK